MQLALLFCTVFAISGIVIVAMLKPSAYERELHARIADVRNPRRVSADTREQGGAGISSSASLGGRVKSYLERYRVIRKLRAWLDQFDHPLKYETLLLQVAGCGLLGGVIAFWKMESVTAALLTGVACAMVPILLIERRRRARLKAISTSLPEATDLMSRALRSGHSMTQTIEVLAEQAPAPLNGIFQQVFQQQRMGVPLRDVLAATAAIVPCRDFQFLITAVLVQRETGGDLAEVLDRTAQVLRDRIRVQGEIAVYTAQGRLTGSILSLLPVVLLALMTAASPNYARLLLSDPTGRRLLLIGGVLILAGGLMIRRLIRVQL